MESVVKFLEVEVPVPDYTTLFRRKRGLEVILPRKCNHEPTHIVADSTGLKVYGEGKWKVRQHGSTKRRTWRKLHLAVDQSSGQIEAVAVTTNSISDGDVLEKLLEQVKAQIKQVSGNGLYDRWDCYEVGLL